MACDVIIQEGIAHFPPLSFRIYHVSLPPQLCLRRAAFYAAPQLDFLYMCWSSCVCVLHCLPVSLQGA